MTRLSMMTRRAVMPLLLALCALVIGSSAANAASTPFADPLSRFSFTLPDGWQAQSDVSDNATFVFTDVPDNATFVITMQPKPESGTLADVTQAFVSIASLSPQYQADAAGVRDTTIGGVPAKTFVYTAQGNSDANATTTTQVYTLIHKDLSLYQFTLAAPPDKAPAAMAAAKSLLDSWMFA